MSTQRQQKLNRLFRDEISEMIFRELKDPRLTMSTIAEVSVAPDLSQAIIYISVQGDAQKKQDSLEGFTSAAGYIRHQLNKRLRLKRIPELEFRLDRAQERGDKILDLLDRVSQDLHKDEESSPSE